MPDISELIIDVKNSQQAVNEIDKVSKKLYQTSKQAETLGKTIFAGWSFTKVIRGIKAFGNAWEDTYRTFVRFETVFGRWNKEANDGVEKLVKEFAKTETEAKKLIAVIGSRIGELGFDYFTKGKLAKQLSQISIELASFYGGDVDEISKKLTNALMGSTKALREFGIVIDKDSDDFKKMTETFMLLNGETQKGAEALAIFNSISEQTKKYKGTFAGEIKSISRELNSFASLMTTGVFARAGEVLSEILVPIVQPINKLVSIPLTQRILGLIAALWVLVGSFKLLKITILGLSRLFPGFQSIFVNLFSTIGTKLHLFTGKISELFVKFSISAGKIYFGFFSSVISKMMDGMKLVFKLMMGKAGVEYFAALMKWTLIPIQKLSPVIAFFASAWGIAFATALITVAGMAIVNKLKTGKWNDFENGFNKWLTEFVEKIKNYFTGAGFITNDVLIKKSFDDILNFFKETSNGFKDLEKRLKEYEKELELSESAPTVDQLIKITTDKIRDSVDRMDKFSEEFKTASFLYNSYLRKVQENMAEIRYQTAQKRLSDPSWVHQDIKRLQELENSYKKALKAYNSALNDYYGSKDKLQKQLLKFQNQKFDLFSWYKEVIDEISNSVKPMKASDKIKGIEERINEFKKVLKLMNTEEQREGYKELGNLYMQKFRLEMEGLNKEREYISKTNEMIQDYLARAMEFKPQGVKGIQANTAEGWKFMTSSLGDLSSLKDVMKMNQNSQQALQKKAVGYAEKATKTLTEIKKDIEKLPQYVPLNLKVIN